MKRTSTLLYYFENDLAQPKSHALSLLYSAKLRENGRTTRLVTRCCYSCLALDHPYYEKNVICVHADACDLFAPHVDPLCRIFTRDWDTAYDGELPPATASLEESEAMWKTFASIIKRPAIEAQGITLQNLLAQLPPATNLDLAQNIRLLPPARSTA